MGFILIIACQFNEKNNCLGASSPTDLEITNSLDSVAFIILLEYSVNDGYSKINELKVEA